MDVETTAVVDRGGSRRQMAGQPRVFVSTNRFLFGLLHPYGPYQEAIDEKAPLVVTSLAEAFDAPSVVDPKFEPVAIPSRPSEGTDSI